MKLEKFKQKDPKKIGITIFTVVCVLLVAGVFFYTSFASFETHDEFNIIEGTVESNGDLYFAFYVDDEISKTMPQKGEGYVLDKEKTKCTKGASVEFNENDWSVKVLNMTETRTKCTLYFKKQPTAVEYILAKGETDELKFDGTVDNNLRYVGADPNNYVSFNNELWRIIGAMNNIDDGTGTEETRLKIIRDEGLDRTEWDSGNINDWTTASLQLYLNGDYLNSINELSKQMIDNTLWHLGGTSSYTSSSNGLASHWYTYERGTTVYSGRPTEWIGKIGLMYPSDYGYATSGGATTNREACLNNELYYWDISSVSDCKNNDWLYNISSYQWTLTSPYSYSYAVFIVYINGHVVGNSAYSTLYALSPALYLSSNVKISGGEGTSSNPYTLSL